MSHTLRSIELFLVRLPLVRPFTTSSHTKNHLDHILIRVTDQDGGQGWGECASASDPYYCSETSETSWHILRDFLAPEVLGLAWEHPDDAARTWRKVRGNNFAKAGLEMACWDLYTRARNEPLAGALGGTRKEIFSGVSLGIEPTIDGPARAGRALPESGLPQDQDEDRPRARRAVPERGARALAGRAADGRRQLGLHARKPRARAGAARRSTA